MGTFSPFPHISATKEPNVSAKDPNTSMSAQKLDNRGILVGVLRTRFVYMQQKTVRPQMVPTCPQKSRTCPQKRKTTPDAMLKLASLGSPLLLFRVNQNFSLTGHSCEVFSTLHAHVQNMSLLWVCLHIHRSVLHLQCFLLFLLL